MEYNNPTEIVKDLNFGDIAKNQIVAGVDKLASAVKSTLGASGKCVIYEDARGKPVITKDGVTVAESVVLYHPVENIGATLIKEASKNTVKEAGGGTTTAIFLSQSLLNNVNNDKAVKENNYSIREVKEGVKTGLVKVNKYLDKSSIEVKGDLLKHVSSISCNNDKELGKIISEAYEKVGTNGVVLMEESNTEETYMDIVDGVQIDCGLTSPHFVTDKEKQRCELDNPLVLIVSSEIPNVRRVQSILEYIIKNKRSLLIMAPVAQQLKTALLMNKVKGNINVNIVDLPGFGNTKQDTIEDLAIITGAKVINEELGDDLELIKPDCLGEVVKSVTDDKNTVLTVNMSNNLVEERIESVRKLIQEEKNGFLKEKLQQRLAILSGSVGIVFVGANSAVELKEKKDRVDDAIYATKAALQEGIVSGGGIALLNAANTLQPDNVGEKILFEAIKSPFKTILANAGIENYKIPAKIGYGYNVITGKVVDMVETGIIDPVLVTKTALKNAISVVSTIVSADCVISNMRLTDESDK